jgi:glutamine phosphoribosylpyrophosphate amidotransferase
MGSYGELMGSHLEPLEIAREIGADSVNYLPIDEYIKETGM